MGRFLEGVDEVRAHHRLDQGEREPATDDGRRCESLVGRDGQSGQSAAHGFSNALRQRALVPAAPALVDVAQRFDEEEGVATRDRGQRPCQLLVVVACLGDVGRDVVGVQTAQREAIGGTVAVQVGEDGRQRMGPVEVGAAVRADDLHAGVLSEPQQMAQQQQGRLGRPVQIVEDQHDGCARGGDPQQRDDGVEQCVTLCVGVGAGWRCQIGQHLGEAGDQGQKRFDAPQPAQPTRPHARHQRPQRLRERLVWRSEVFVAPAIQDHRTLLVGLTGPFACQPRLPHARFTGDQHGIRARRQHRLPGGEQPLEFGAPADERAAAGEHGGQVGSLQRLVLCGSADVVGVLQAEFEDVLGTGEVLQLPQTEIRKDDVVGQRVDDELGGRTGAQDLATRRQ